MGAANGDPPRETSLHPWQTRARMPHAGLHQSLWLRPLRQHAAAQAPRRPVLGLPGTRGRADHSRSHVSALSCRALVFVALAAAVLMSQSMG
jgi:hypothetical protein